MVTWQAEVLCDGRASGEVLRLTAPISFWGGVNPKTGSISSPQHPEYGATLKAKVLIVPQLIGSSSSAAIMLELLYRSLAPSGIIIGQCDAILPIGAIVARQMGWARIPVFQRADLPVKTGDLVEMQEGGAIGHTTCDGPL